MLPLRAYARASPSCASGTTGQRDPRRVLQDLLIFTDRVGEGPFCRNASARRYGGTSPATVPNSVLRRRLQRLDRFLGLVLAERDDARVTGPRTVRTNVD